MHYRLPPLLFLVFACGSPVEPAGPDGGLADAGSADAARTPDAGLTPDAAPAAPSVSEAFASCTSPGPAGGLGDGDQIMRVDLDTTAFPNAVCNDGTGAVMYVRRAADATHVNRWVIQLQGGGGCRSGDDCARRWCSVDTNFGALKMSSDFAPERGTFARGVLSSRGDSQFAGWNHVLVYYCSSDSWSGTRGAITVAGEHPVAARATTRRWRPGSSTGAATPTS